jgi:hypothetical protein
MSLRNDRFTSTTKSAMACIRCYGNRSLADKRRLQFAFSQCWISRASSRYAPAIHNHQGSEEREVDTSSSKFCRRQIWQSLHCDVQMSVSTWKVRAIRTSLARRSIQLSAAIIIGLSVLPSKSPAQYGLFSELPGDWSGAGQLTLDNRKERIRCRAVYDVSEEGNELNQRLACATSEIVFQLDTTVIYRGGLVSGGWKMTKFSGPGRTENSLEGNSGALVGQASNGHFKVTILMGESAAASLSLTTYGNIQSAEISSDVHPLSMSIRLARTP